MLSGLMLWKCHLHGAYCCKDESSYLLENSLPSCPFPLLLFPDRRRNEWDDLLISLYSVRLSFLGAVMSAAGDVISMAASEDKGDLGGCRPIDLTYASLHSSFWMSLACLFRPFGSLPATVFPAQLQEQGREVHGGLKSCLLSLNPRMKPDFRNTFVFAFIFRPCLVSFPFLSCTLISQVLGLWNDTVFTQEVTVTSARGWDLVPGLLQSSNLSGMPLLTPGEDGYILDI